ncbi:hypothetical protein, partial [Marinibactrum halimedae]|uniref:hypothetical protein n=1 Tax=Marinibactrum halimedae TaxID=1444977 RepID=UPI0024E166CC
MKKLPLYTAITALSLTATSNVFANEICSTDALRSEMKNLMAQVKATPKTDPMRAEYLNQYFDTKAELESCKAIIEQAQWVDDNCDMDALRTEMSTTMAAVKATPKTDPTRAELLNHYTATKEQYQSCKVAIADVQDYIDNNGNNGGDNTDSETTVPTNEAPQIALTGANPLYVNFKSQFVDPGATAT